MKSETLYRTMVAVGRQGVAAATGARDRHRDRAARRRSRSRDLAVPSRDELVILVFSESSRLSSLYLSLIPLQDEKMASSLAHNVSC